MRFSERTDSFFPSPASIEDREPIATPCLSLDRAFVGIPSVTMDTVARDEMLKSHQLMLRSRRGLTNCLRRCFRATSAHRNIDRVALLDRYEQYSTTRRVTN